MNWLELLARITEVVVWPAVVLFGLISFHEPLSGFLKRVANASFKGLGIEASASMLDKEMTKIEKAAPSAGQVVEEDPPWSKLPPLTPRGGIEHEGWSLLHSLWKEASRRGCEPYAPSRVHPEHYRQAALALGFSVSDADAIEGLGNILQSFMYGAPRDVTMEEYGRYRRSAKLYLHRIQELASVPVDKDPAIPAA